MYSAIFIIQAVVESLAHVANARLITNVLHVLLGLCYKVLHSVRPRVTIEADERGIRERATATGNGIVMQLLTATAHSH